MPLNNTHVSLTSPLCGSRVRTFASTNHNHAQRGAALVVSLLLLLVITLLAVSSMNTASLELQMAGNAQFGQNAYEAAEAGIARAIRAGMPTSQDAPKIVVATEIVAGSPSTYETTTTLMCTGPAVGGSFGKVSKWHYEIQSTGRSSRGARSERRQGYFEDGAPGDIPC